MSDEQAAGEQDVVVVGGGAAGLSAAIALARSLRSVTVVDAGEPRNAPADGVHNLLGREGTPPGELLAAGRREAEAYGVRLLADRVVGARRSGLDDRHALEVDLAGGGRLHARRLVLAGGLVDRLPDVPGVRECWGHSVLHCPYCHGYEVRGRRIVVLGTGPMSAHQAKLFRQLSDDVTLVDHDMPDPGEETWQQLTAIGVRVVRARVARLDHQEGEARAIVLEDGTELPADAVVVTPRFVANGELFEQLGGTLADSPVGDHFIPTEAMGRTAVPGVFAAGNVVEHSAMVGASAAAGVQVGALVNADLVEEDAHRAVRDRGIAGHVR